MTAYLFLRSLLAPPALHILLVLLGLWLLRRQRLWLGRGLIAVTLLSLYLMTTPWLAQRLARSLEPEAALNIAQRDSWKGAGAIVVIGGGLDMAPEFGGRDMPNYWTASRVRYGAFLYREIGVPLLVSGGTLPGGKEAEAAVMARSLQLDHIVNVRWQEMRSRTTWENARFSHELLAAEGIKRILLVTQGMHMRRARQAFEHAGFEVIPAPVDLTPPAKPGSLLLRFAPDPSSFVKSSQALHEYGGLVFYGLRAWLD